MTTALVTHDAATRHLNPDGHPEQVARIVHVLKALEGREVTRVSAPLAAEDDLLRVHPRGYLEALRRAGPDEGWTQIDGDTFMSPGTLEAATRAVGGAVRAVDMVMAGEAVNAFVAMRPPGHHAERETAMGFCYFGTVAVAAKHALDHHGLSRVAVVDFDVHHGNGTQDLLEDDARVFFASSHQSPLFPGTGAAHDTGPHGTVMNVPLRAGTGSAEFRRVWEREILPAVRAHRPELVLVSAGFDAHRADPLASLDLTEADFEWVTAAICALAAEVCGGRVVSSLEGGYDLDALGRSAAAHVDSLIEAAKRVVT
ncbi:histone deacetylase family protein [Roseovarius sp. SCSIO 43702]|uniref:histone deacetylase family protein n=1 Tax=Roseovarius sp. SCSIO 43702 TaxID=2823043 RepID=UPI001C72B9FF|nr:histone deacetylase family protein [Roseovarius sp. SCSIO 43702]QYX56256.1 histone deacetylase family protein [Roseovarius sp. SCSIO 43702]